MKRPILCLFLALGAMPAEAALSGFYDSTEQIQTILADEKVADALHQAPIGAISNTGTRKDGAKEWTIRVQECDLKVYLKPISPAMPGKTSYEIDVPRPCE